MNKTTACILREALCDTTLAHYRDIIKTQAGADFYVGQTRYVVEQVVDIDETKRHVYLNRPKDQQTKP